MRCSACGFENPIGMRFCGNCGTALAAVSSSAEERKLVTVLFADVVSSTQLAGTVDPEQLRDWMARLFGTAPSDCGLAQARRSGTWWMAWPWPTPGRWTVING